MNYTKFILIALLSNIVLVTSCKKDDEDINTSNAPFKAKIDGQVFESKTGQAKYVSSTKMLQILGQDNNLGTLHFQLLPLGGTVNSASEWVPAEYDYDPIHISEMKYSASANYTASVNGTYVNWTTKWDYVQAGKIKIESNSGTHIKGTFSADLVKLNTDGSHDPNNIKKVTDGEFDLEISIY